MLETLGIDYWLFGGWAVDFHAGRTTRSHDDVDIAVWIDDLEGVEASLAADGWSHVPDEGEDGYTAYELDSVRLEIAFLASGRQGDVYTPLREGRGEWPSGSFGGDIRELLGVRARVIALPALKLDKAEQHADPRTAAKDRADQETLDRL